ncbi:structural protein [Cellulophaga phage phi19:2]|uniref:Structural protein n=3 Tax=Cellulophaga phage phiST TaxID=756282 RepID=M4SLB8_9CAUD|nr:virion structural protein [Cellulophaga phage phiST]AGH56783.1 hypothetical protein CGPG_00085 [Cellulophaga phage phiST]AGO47161.1 structural protein [Cellulophaga phage phiST]AGO48657.1 structural protein [Cellulophaga phage phi19:2]AGO49027.1 structural protein [Cellulophaga phage phi13:1]
MARVNYLFQDKNDYALQDKNILLFSKGADINFTIGDEIFSSDTKYCYLFEPLLISITGNRSSSFSIDLEIKRTETGAVVAVLEDYVYVETHLKSESTIDLMKIVRQHTNSNIFNINNINDITWKTIVCEYKYFFRIRTDGSASPIIISVLPIFGGRSYQDFTIQEINQQSKLKMVDVLDEDIYSLWKNVPHIETILKDPTAFDSTPTINITTPQLGKSLCGGCLIWKSFLGGWSTWSFDIAKRSSDHSYLGSIQSDQFESVNGYKATMVDYSQIQTIDSIELISSKVTKKQALILNELNQSPAIYYKKNNDDRLELVKLTSTSIPIDSINSGGEVKINVKSLLIQKQTTL